MEDDLDGEVFKSLPNEEYMVNFSSVLSDEMDNEGQEGAHSGSKRLH